MRAFLFKLRGLDLLGHFGFAFDTKFDSSFAGSAAKAIENQLKRSGLMTIMPRESAFVIGRQKDQKGRVKLKDGKEERFKKIGVSIASLLNNQTVSEPIVI
jgi:hypothetical protein